MGNCGSHNATAAVLYALDRTDDSSTPQASSLAAHVTVHFADLRSYDAQVQLAPLPVGEAGWPGVPVLPGLEDQSIRLDYRSHRALLPMGDQQSSGLFSLTKFFPAEVTQVLIVAQGIGGSRIPGQREGQGPLELVGTFTEECQPTSRVSWRACKNPSRYIL